MTANHQGPLLTVTHEKGVVEITAPTFADVPYGDHPKQVLHFWKATSIGPAPLLVFIHGGGWTSGSRTDARFCDLLPRMLRAGISVASVGYRFIQDADSEKIVPPVKACLHDAARALQFVRSRSGTWGFDKTRVAVSGGSAGSCTSLWLAFHPELGDPNSPDPVARESTRVTCAAVAIAQTTLDPRQMREWTPNSVYGGHAFGIRGGGAKAFEEFLTRRQELLPFIAEYSPYALVGPGAPPVYLWYGTPPAFGKEEKDPTHTANFGVKLSERCKDLGVDCELVYPGATGVKHATVAEYLIEYLRPTPEKHVD